jgi:tetratricopeptide (TPR) repeat protein
MHRPRHRLALFTCALLASAASAGAGEVHSATIIGPTNPLLADGTAALEAGRFEEGVRLTLAGLDRPNNTHDEAAAHSNVCAGYAALKRWHDALTHCNRALEIDRGNWRTFANRAAVFVGLKMYDLAVTDVNAGLELEPASRTLHKSMEVVNQHRRAAERDRRRRPTKA